MDGLDFSTGRLCQQIVFFNEMHTGDQQQSQKEKTSQEPGAYRDEWVIDVDDDDGDPFLRDLHAVASGLASVGSNRLQYLKSGIQHPVPSPVGTTG